MNLNLLNDDSIQPSEPVVCDFYIGNEAIKIAEQLGLPNLELVREAIMVGDAEFRTNTIFNRARFIARWGKIGEQLALRLQRIDKNWVFHNQSQPRLENIDKKIQIIFMSGNIALGLADQIISAHCEKGLMTLKNIKENQSTYDDESKLRTWILYFPSATHPAYCGVDIPSIPFEFAYPTSFVQNIKNEKISILPSNHTCRIAFDIDNTRPTKTDIKPVIETSDEISSDDFDIQLVV
ncbi:hypothetical protein EC844_105151 [Acinetobacter calcoaceticus]|uniref:Uncharacterized protein n=1 Tax=Acinetobacter calcoaceticus TaxID=471 RepID=A0A4R1XV77_ACICA|nr:hypothetical protein EC844_105151 [Acinetobacter calcoaceticus]